MVARMKDQVSLLGMIVAYLMLQEDTKLMVIPVESLNEAAGFNVQVVLNAENELVIKIGDSNPLLPN